MTPTKNESLPELLARTLPFLRDEADKYDDDGSNEPLELARDIESALTREAPTDGIDEDSFAQWLAKEMPAGTVIGNPTWWANRIARQYLSHATHHSHAQVEDVRHLISSLQSMRDRLGVVLYEFGDAFDGDMDTLLEVINHLKRATPPAPQRQSSNPSGLSSESDTLSSEQRMAQGEECTGCSGHGEVGGLTPQGYESSECPYCKGTGQEATQPPHQDRGEVEQRAEESVGQYDPHAPPHCPTCECCARKTGGDQGAMDAKRWRDLTAGWGGMQERVDGRVFMHISTPQWEVPKDCRDIGDAFDRRYELDNAAREKAGE